LVGAATAWRQADALRDAGIKGTYDPLSLAKNDRGGEFRADRNSAALGDYAEPTPPKCRLGRDPSGITSHNRGLRIIDKRGHHLYHHAPSQGGRRCERYMAFMAVPVAKSSLRSAAPFQRFFGAASCARHHGRYGF